VGVYQEARALRDEGLLKAFICGFYFDPESSKTRWIQWLPGRWKDRLIHELRRRGSDDLNSRDVISHPFWDILVTLSSRAGLSSRTTYGLLAHRNERFERAVAADIRRLRPDGVICYDSAALRPFEACDHVGAVKVLDQVIGHIQAATRIAELERSRNPEFADSFPIFPEHGLLERCTAEIRAADHIMAPSDYVVKTLVDAGADPSKISLFPYGVDTELFRPALTPREENEEFHILYAGQLSQRKGIKYLLQAFKELRIPQSRLTLLGPVIGQGRGFAPYEGLFQHVSGIPHHAMPEFYQKADVFVFPSLHEGSANVTYEALASGLPVITTFESGSVVRDSVDGYIVPAGHVEALKDRILNLYHDRDRRRQMAIEARRRAEQFTWTAFRHRVIDHVRQWQAN